MGRELQIFLRVKDMASKTLDRVRGKFARFTSGIRKMITSTAGQVIGGYLGIQGVRALSRYGAEAVALAGKIEGMQQAFDALGEKIGFTNETMNKLRKATDNTVTDFKLLEQANNAMLLGIAKSDDEMAELFDTAQRLARAVGKDAAFGIESLVTGLGRQSRLMLDNLGIIVKSNQAYEEYAESIGKTVTQLTEAEKKTAFLKAGMESAREKVEALGKEQLTASDKIAMMNKRMEDLKQTIGRILIPTLNLLLPIVESLVGAFEKWAGVTEKIKPTKIQLLNAEIERFNALIVVAKTEQLFDPDSMKRIAGYEAAIRSVRREMAEVKKEQAQKLVAAEEIVPIDEVLAPEQRKATGIELIWQAHMDRMVAMRKEAADKMQAIAQHSAMMQAHFAMQMGQAMAVGIGKGTEGLKESFKASLIVLLNFLQAKLIATRVASLMNIIATGGIGAPLEIAKIIAVTAAFTAAKAAIMSFKSGTSFAPGGMARVHKDETVFLPRGSQVSTAEETRQTMGGRQQITIAPVFNAPVDQSAVGPIINKLDELGQQITQAVRGGYVNLRELTAV